MFPQSTDHADRFDAIRRANRRRPATVVGAFDLTPHMRRVVLRELEPISDRPAKPAEWIKLHVPCSGEGRKHGRAYTIRERSSGRLTIDMAMHDGLCASWARHASPGDRVDISGPRQGFRLAWPPDEVLLGADETGLAAVATIVAGLPHATRGEVWLEVPDARDVLPLDAPPSVAVRFLPRGAEPPGHLLTQAMRTALVSPMTAVWVAAERAAALELREHFEAVLPPKQVLTSGYWRVPCREPAIRCPFPDHARPA
jgi:NADPH-dependent ferric siderophore reductase